MQAYIESTELRKVNGHDGEGEEEGGKIIVSRNAYSWGGFLPMKCSSNVEKTECKPVYNVERVFPRCGTRCSSVRHRLPVKLQLYAFQFFRGGGGRTNFR